MLFLRVLLSWISLVLSLFALWSWFIAFATSDGPSSSPASISLSIDDSPEHSMCNSLLELFFFNHANHIVNTFFVDFDLAKIALSCHFALDLLSQGRWHDCFDWKITSWQLVRKLWRSGWITDCYTTSCRKWNPMKSERDTEKRSGKLSEDQKLSKLCSDARLRSVEIWTILLCSLPKPFCLKSHFLFERVLCLSRSRALWWFFRVSSVCNQSQFAAYPSVVMAVDHACEDALHTSLLGSPPLSSNVGSPNGSGHDLNGMVSRSIDEQLMEIREMLLPFVPCARSVANFENNIQIITNFVVPHIQDCQHWTDRQYLYLPRCLIRRNGSELPLPHCTLVQCRRRHGLNLKRFRFRKILERPWSQRELHRHRVPWPRIIWSQQKHTTKTWYTTQHRRWTTTKCRLFRFLCEWCFKVIAKWIENFFEWNQDAGLQQTFQNPLHGRFRVSEVWFWNMSYMWRFYCSI